MSMAQTETGGDVSIAVARRKPRRISALTRHVPLAVSVTILAVLILAALIGPLLWRANATGVDLGSALQGLSRDHPMGTDDLGRDVLARVLAGARLSLVIGILVTAVGAAVGGSLGVTAGLVTNKFDGFFSLVINTLLAFPPLMLAIAVAIALGSGVWSSAVGLMVAAVPWYARVIRSEVIRIRGTLAVESARSLGASTFRIVRRNLIPHLLPTLVIQAASSFGWAILFMASLSFVGLGAQPPTAEWGAMITKGLDYALTGQWWIGVFPGIGLVVAVCAATLVADGLRDLLDPQSSAGRG